MAAAPGTCFQEGGWDGGGQNVWIPWSASQSPSRHAAVAAEKGSFYLRAAARRPVAGVFLRSQTLLRKKMKSLAKGGGTQGIAGHLPLRPGAPLLPEAGTAALSPRSHSSLPRRARSSFRLSRRGARSRRHAFIRVISGLPRNHLQPFERARGELITFCGTG